MVLAKRQTMPKKRSNTKRNRSRQRGKGVARRKAVVRVTVVRVNAGVSKSNQKQKQNPSKIQMTVKSHYPELFCVEVPKFKDGEIQTDENVNVIYIREYGE